MAIAVFSYPGWTAMFPELASVTEPVADAFFVGAGFLLDNTDCSPIADVARRLVLLNYATAHLASLAGYPLQPGQTVPASSGMVGRVSSATEGSVSISSDYGAVSESEAFWLQSQYGAIFWQMTRGLRTMRYVAPAPRYFGPALGGFAGRRGF